MIIRNNFPLSNITYYKIGGRAKVFLEVENGEDVLSAFFFLRKNSIKNILPLGIGANILISDKDYEGVVLHFKKPQSPRINLQKNTIQVFAGHLLDDVIQSSFDNNMIGLEWAGGLPSTVGAAIRGNVGAFGGDVSKTFYKAEVVDIHDSQLRLRELSLSEMEFGYRDSMVKKNKDLVIVNGFFKLKKGSDAEVKQAKKEYSDHIQYRETHHPMEYPSCGSVFKNITQKDKVERIISVWPSIESFSKEKWHGKISMGYVIDKLGFTGKIIGGAQVSEKHSNYIVNKNNATFQNIVDLIEEIKQSFHKTFNFYPELEVEIVY